MPWDCCLICTPTRGVHSRGILTFAVELLSHTHTNSWCQLKRHTDICRGIAVSYAHPLLFRLKRQIDNCRDLLYLYNPLIAPLKKHAVCCMEPLFFISFSHCYNSGLKPTSADSRDNTVYCRGPFTLFTCVEYILLIIALFVTSYNISSDHK